MCRYAFHHYKPHYACFKCRKAFKRRLLYDIDENAKDSNPSKCPQCGNLMADMGLDFKSPAKNDKKAWENLSKLYQVGITFHSCGCNGPGYIPRNKTELLNKLEQTLSYYHKRLEEFRNDKAMNEKEKAEAIQYWINKVKILEERIFWVKQNYN